MEAALGADFSNVRVHVGPQAERIGAVAFTMGTDIYFAPSRFQPDTVQGQQLLGHELAHVVQQRQGRVRNPAGTGVAVVQDLALEAEADRLGHQAAARQIAAQPKMAPRPVQPSSPIPRSEPRAVLGRPISRIPQNSPPAPLGPGSMERGLRPARGTAAQPPCSGLAAAQAAPKARLQAQPVTPPPVQWIQNTLAQPKRAGSSMWPVAARVASPPLHWPGNPAQPHPALQRKAAPANGVIQRAITVGTQLLPRTVSMKPDLRTVLTTNNLLASFEELNDDREVIYMFSNDDHLLNYLKMKAGQVRDASIPEPIKHKVSSTQLQQGHGVAQDMRFSTIYQPTSNQVSQNAPGVHQIPNPMMPPSGLGHHWGQSPGIGGIGQEYTIFENQLQPPTSQTLPLTFGDPDAPSLVMSQGGQNLGMHIRPTFSSTCRDDIKRSDTRYAGLPSVTTRVRGHPFELKQNQISTDDPNVTFDNDRRTYTDEMDSTQPTGGISSWRYNEIEHKAVKSGLSFTQINNNPSIGPMGVSRPDVIHFRLETSTGGYDDLAMDNTGVTDYRNTKRPKRVGKQAFQTSMGRKEALTNPYQPPPIHHPGDEFLDPHRYSYPGYMSPPPTPFLSEDTLSEAPIEIIVNGYPNVHSRVKNLKPGYEGIVVEVIDRDKVRVKTRCKVRPVPTVSWPGWQ
jgi:hypothetical protein